MKKLIFAAMLCVLPLSLFADETKSSETKITDSTLSDSDTVAMESWNLTPEEFQEYKTLMKGVRGVWSPNLDPVTVLGINAKSDAERQRYAVKLVKIERARVTRELAFEMAYQKAQEELFGHIPLYETSETKAAAVLGGLGEASKAKAVNVFISKKCGACKSVSTELLKSGVKANFYFVGFSGDAIKQWAVDVGITGAMISQKQTTLNFDAGRAEKLNIQTFPFVQDAS